MSGSSHLLFMVQTSAGQSVRGQQDGVGDAAQFNQPFGLAVENEQTLLISDTNANSPRRLDMQSRTVSTLIQSKPDAQGFVDGSLSQASLFQPWGVLADAGDVLVGHVDLRVLRNNYVYSRAGANAQGNQDGAANTARFTAIVGMARLFDGSYLLCDSNRFRRLIPPKYKS